MVTKQTKIMACLASIFIITSIFLYTYKSNLFYPTFTIGEIWWAYYMYKKRDWFSLTTLTIIVIAAIFCWSTGYN